MYPSIVALQNTEREIEMKLREYKQAVEDYTALAAADDAPESKRCPYAQPFPLYSTNADGTLGVKDGACCPDGDISTSGRWPRRNARDIGHGVFGPEKDPLKTSGHDIPGNDISSKKGTAEQCVAACSTMPACKAVVTAGSGDSLTCLFKSVDGPAVSSPGADVYVMGEPRPCGGGGGGKWPSTTVTKPNTNITAATVSEIVGVDVDACNIACTNSEKCVAFSYTPATQQCELKSSASPTVPSPEGDPLIDDGTDCKTWGCSCQGLANRFGIRSNLSFGCAPAAAVAAWKESGCNLDENGQPIQPDPGTVPVGCGSPSPATVQEMTVTLPAKVTSGATDRTAMCQTLSEKFGIVPGQSSGCASPDIMKVWTDWQCNPDKKWSAESTYSGCTPTRHTNQVDSYILNSPKPCKDQQGNPVGYPDWCKSGQIGSCSDPPCQASGGTCPPTHPYPFAKDGVEDSACCDKPQPPPDPAPSLFLRGGGNP